VVTKKILARGEKRLAASSAHAMVRPTNHTACCAKMTSHTRDGHAGWSGARTRNATSFRTQGPAGGDDKSLGRNAMLALAPTCIGSEMDFPPPAHLTIE
jgi:hypothetical protein